MKRLVTLICCLILATTAIPASAQPSPNRTPDWTVTDQLDIQVDGTPYLISPDGAWLAGSGPNDDFCVWSIPDLDESCAGTRLRIQIESIAWAPDSSAVAFSEDAAVLLIDSDIQIFDIESQSIVNLTDDPDENSEDIFPPSEDGSITHVDVMPLWSADSSTITFVRNDYGQSIASTEIMSIDLETLEIEQRFVISPIEWFAVFRPIFNLPDGSVLITISHADPDNQQNGIWKIAADGSRIDPIYRFGSEESSLGPAVIDLSADGSTAIVALLAKVSDDPTEASAFFQLDLSSGDTRTIPGPDSSIDSAIIAGYPKFVAESLDIAYPGLDPETDDATISLDPDDPIILIENLDRDQILGGFQWSESNLILLRGTDGSAAIFTLEAENADATPLAPCSCSPTEDD